MNKVKELIRHPLISGSSIILVGSMLSNIVNYLFNLLMGRLLIPADYGLMTSLTSLMILFTIFQFGITGIFAKFSAKFYANKAMAELSSLVKMGTKFTILLSTIVLFILLLTSGLIGNFLHTSNIWLVVLISVSIFFSIMISLPYGIFQGEVRVVLYSFSTFLAAFSKIALGVVLVVLGLKIFGAVIGITVGTIAPCLLSYVVVFYGLRKKAKGEIKEQSALVKEIKNYSIPFFLATLGITLFTSIDTILARHFLTPLLAGQYAALSLMGKAIFYATFPIFFVFFPLVAQQKEKKGRVTNLLLLGFAMVILVSVAASFVYFFLPGLVLKIFFPRPEYKILAPYLGPFSLFILVFSLANLLSSFLLSIGKTKIYVLNIAGGIILVVLMSFIHSSLAQIIQVLFGSSFLLLAALLIYYFKYGRD